MKHFISKHESESCTHLVAGSGTAGQTHWKPRFWLSVEKSWWNAVFLSLWVILETTGLLGWLHTGSTARFISPPLPVEHTAGTHECFSETSCTERQGRFSLLLMMSRLPVCFPDDRAPYEWMNMNVSAWNRKSTSTAVRVHESGIWWEKHMTQSSSFRNSVLFGKNSSPFSSAENRYWREGGRNWWFQRNVLPEVSEPLIFHYEVPFHQNEAIHHCSCGTPTTNPALCTLIWDTLIWDTLCLNLQCLFRKK